MNIIGKVSGAGIITFDSTEQREIINLYFLGQKNCNEVNDQNEIVPVDHKNIDKVKDAHYNVSGQYHCVIDADLTDTGRLINLRIKQ